MSQFEQDIRTSLNTIQTQLAAVQQRAEGANASIARMAPAARQAASGVGDIERNVGKVTAAATRAGGPIAGMMTQLGGLAAFNPLALAAGVAIGGITTAVYQLVGALKAANEEQEKLNATVAAAPGQARTVGEDVLRKQDPNILRFGVTTEQRQRNLEAFRKSAPGAVLNAEQELQVSLGRGDMDPEDFRRMIAMELSSPRARQADVAERLQREEAANSAAATFRAGQLVSGGAMSASERADAVIAGSPELKASLDALNQTLKEQRAGMSGLQFLGSQERSEAAIRETQEKIQVIRDQVAAASY